MELSLQDLKDIQNSIESALGHLYSNTNVNDKLIARLDNILERIEVEKEKY